MFKILVIIPAFNEQDSISSVINDLVNNSNIILDILVIDDGSTDDTYVTAINSAKASVVKLPINSGIGGAVQTGLIFADRNNYDIAIQFDGDGQHLASEIKKLIQPIIEASADIIIGSRFIDKDSDNFKSSFLRRIGIKYFYFLNYLLIGQKITDNTSGFRAYNKKSIRFLAQNYPSDFPEPESAILLGRNKFKIKEVSALMKERLGGTSSISGFKSVYYMIKVTVAILFAFSRKPIKQK